ncbi:MAG TPA: hypothetical protein VGO93_02925 [Candidatus Xenobia bacterium]|jgi:hypothetical protein
MKCERVERRVAAEETLDCDETLHVLGCDHCGRFAELMRDLDAALPQLSEPSLWLNSDALLAQRVLSEHRQPVAGRGVPFLPLPGLAGAWRASLAGGFLALGLLAANRQFSEATAWEQISELGSDSRLLTGCAALLVALLAALMFESGRWFLVRCGLLARPEGAPEGPARQQMANGTLNPIYFRYLGLWTRSAAAVPGVLAGCMAMAAPLRVAHVPWLSVGVLFLWALAQGLPRGYFVVSSERHGGTYDLVRMTGLSGRETAQGYFFTAAGPTAVELLAGSAVLLIVAAFEWMPMGLAVACVLLTWGVGAWSIAAGISLGRSGARPVDLLSGLGLLALSVAGIARLILVPTGWAWTGFLGSLSLLFGSLSAGLLNGFEQGWGEDPASLEPAPEGRYRMWSPPIKGVGPFVSVAVRSYARAWQRNGLRQLVGLSAVLVPLGIWGPERGMPAIMLIFLLWGFSQAFRVMDREQHRATMSLLMVTPLSTAAMFGGQLLTAVLPLLLPWGLHSALAVFLDPAMAGAVLTVSGLSLLLGLFGAALGLLNRYAISLELVERSST